MDGRIPNGKGIFIYVLSSSWPGSMASLADYLKANNYDWVAPKMQDGQLPFNTDLMDEFVREIKRAGIDLVGWGYVYGETTAWRKINNWCVREKNVTIDMIGKYKPVAWIVNAEKEHKNNSGAAASAKKYMDSVKAEMSITNDAIPDVPLGFSSYKFPDSHHAPPNYTFPFVEFISRSDFIAPQVYWWGTTEALGGANELQMSIFQYDEYNGAGLPYVPAGTFRNDAGTWWATVEQMDAFNNLCQTLENVSGFNYWDLRFGQQRVELKETIDSFIWDFGDEPEPPEPPEGDAMQEIIDQLTRIADELVIMNNTLSGGVPVDPTDPTDPIDPTIPTDPTDPVEPPAWLEKYSWQTNAVLREWASPWDVVPSDEKAKYKIVNTPEDDPYTLRIPHRKDNYSIQRNAQGGIIFTSSQDQTEKAPPKVHDGTFEFGAWGFEMPLKAGSQADAGKAVVLIGDAATPGHEFYVIPPGRVERVE